MNIGELVSTPVPEEQQQQPLPPHVQEQAQSVEMAVETNAVEASPVDMQPSEQETANEESSDEAPQEAPILTSLHLAGVDKLATSHIKKYIDSHIKPNYSYEVRKQYAYLEYKLNWINDSEINIVFDYNTNKEKRNSNKNEYRSRGSRNVYKTGKAGKEEQEEGDLMDLIGGFNPKKQKESIEPSTDTIATETEKDDDEMKDDTNDAPENATNENTEPLVGLENESIKGAAEAIMLLTDFDNIRKEHEEFAALSIEDQFKAVNQAPKLHDRKCWELVLTPNGEIIRTKGAKKLYGVYQYVVQGKIEETMEENVESEEDIFPEGSQIINLEVRYSTKSDRKERDSRLKSNYYKTHGEPSIIERLPTAKEDSTYYPGAFDEADLITHEKPETHGLFGYEGDRDETDVTKRRYNESRKRSFGGDKWKSDKFYNPRADLRNRIGKSRQSYGGRGRNRGGRHQSNRNRGGNRRGGNGHYQGEDLFPGYLQGR